ncbi:MAG: hypothetical protein TIS_00556 [Tissierella sp.]
MYYRSVITIFLVVYITYKIEGIKEEVKRVTEAFLKMKTLGFYVNILRFSINVYISLKP